jgi:asparagine N-glycosylation enzyme membrane subunit Stt3
VRRRRTIRRRRLHARLAGEFDMLYTIAVILLVAWLLGFLGIYTIGSFVHVLLVVAIVLFLVGLLSGRRVLG